MPSKCILELCNRPSFFAKFRTVAAGFLAYLTEKEKESPVYDDCPSHCDIDNKPRATFCEGCPIGILRDEYQTDVETELGDMPGNRYGFDYLNECVINVITLPPIDRRSLTLNTARLLEIVDQERGRIRRVQDWNKKQKTNDSGS